jgi:hypothetical protein
MQGLHITGIASRRVSQHECKGAARSPGGPFAFSKRAGRLFLALGWLGVIAVLITASQVAAAASITQPSRSPFTVSGNLAPIPVVATGFAPNANVFVEQCDGTSPSDPRWSPTVNCDLGSSPPPASADGRGTASFQGQRAFQPFVGESPQALFNCVGARMRPPANRLQSFDNCQLRVSTNNSTRTSDQVFLTLVLPSTAPPPTTTPPTTTAAQPKTGASATHHTSTTGKTPTTTTVHSRAGSATATTLPVTTTTNSRAATAQAQAQAEALGAARKSGGEPSPTDSGAVAGFALIAVGAAIAVAALLVGRGIRRVAHR